MLFPLLQRNAAVAIPHQIRDAPAGQGRSCIGLLLSAAEQVAGCARPGSDEAGAAREWSQRGPERHLREAHDGAARPILARLLLRLLLLVLTAEDLRPLIAHLRLEERELIQGLLVGVSHAGHAAHPLLREVDRVFSHALRELIQVQVHLRGGGRARRALALVDLRPGEPGFARHPRALSRRLGVDLSALERRLGGDPRLSRELRARVEAHAPLGRLLADLALDLRALARDRPLGVARLLVDGAQRRLLRAGDLAGRARRAAREFGQRRIEQPSPSLPERRTVRVGELARREQLAPDDARLVRARAQLRAALGRVAEVEARAQHAREAPELVPDQPLCLREETIRGPDVARARRRLGLREQVVGLVRDTLRELDWILPAAEGVPDALLRVLDLADRDRVERVALRVLERVGRGG